MYLLNIISHLDVVFILGEVRRFLDEITTREADVELKKQFSITGSAAGSIC